MRRVSSRQRISACSVFDATPPSGEDDYDMSDEEEEYENCVTFSPGGYFMTPCSGPDDVVVVTGSEEESEFPTKRKRSSRSKEEPAAFVTPSTVDSERSSSPASIAMAAIDLPVMPFVPIASDSGVTAQCGHSRQQVIKNPFQLYDDVLLQVFSFLDHKTARSVSQVNRRTRRLLASSDSGAFWKSQIFQRWPALGSASTSSVNIVEGFGLTTPAVTNPLACWRISAAPNHSLLLSLASSKSTVDVDESLFIPARAHQFRGLTFHQGLPAWLTASITPQLKVIETTAESNERPTRNAHPPRAHKAIVFTGTVGQGDRCIRGDQPLPKPELLTRQQRHILGKPLHRSLLHRLRTGCQRSHHPIWKPFVAPFVTEEDNNGNICVHLTPRLVSYFEVSILHATEETPDLHGRFALTPRTVQGQRTGSTPAATPAPEEMAGRRPATECVAVGLATEAFDLHRRMPGWDSHSYGYHGDDGGIFHASGNMLKSYGPRYGVGDTIGCGIDYHKQAIFFTLNGKFLGYAFSNLDRSSVLTKNFYPVVGMDTSFPISCNFGSDRPFGFDLNSMVHEQKDIVLESLPSPHNHHHHVEDEKPSCSRIKH